ncbi:hypothetical protein BCR35DRAFT_304754 [Leucosporidium creatinivorum]|uniref:RING-type domain-containing protein n=1 Tax=Leucosporidium creatinivorum TaxID=106004 RepID=A0A1Y2F8V1_9BASI|nr:hypothetical protein BCR35DRAFT_304754 [Leucosporidium creatinivorum]
MLLCLGCSTDLTRASQSASNSPNFSEKPAQPPVVFPCEHAVCDACVRRNRRLAQSCLMCSTVQDVLGKSDDKRGAVATSGLPSYGEKGAAVEEEAGDFVLGDSDDEDERDAPPPPVDAEERLELPPAYEDAEGVAAGAAGDEKREQLVLHYIKPQDTLLGLSLQYKVEGPVLCRMNKLPLSTLSTTPHLLHTLPFLLLPPRRPLPPPLRFTHPPSNFQRQTRCVDWAMANTYVSTIFDAREKEAEFVRSNRAARGDVSAGEVEVREGGELEEAIEQWERDERWEREQGKGTGKMGSRIKSTGQVEGKVKGWVWPR